MSLTDPTLGTKRAAVVVSGAAMLAAVAWCAYEAWIAFTR